MLGMVSAFEPAWLKDVLALRGRRASAAALLLVAMNGQMLGLARLSYSLATNRQIPSAAGRLHERRGTPYIAITIAARDRLRCWRSRTTSTSWPASSPSAR